MQRTRGLLNYRFDKNILYFFCQKIKYGKLIAKFEFVIIVMGFELKSLAII